MNITESPAGERLVKILSAAGAASRRGAGDLVKAGRVAVDGVPVTEPGFRVSGAMKVTLDGKAVNPPAGAFLYVMLNKPRGFVCTNEDRFAEKKAIDLIRLDPPARLFSAGRLDKESEGMIIFTNDGDFVEKLTHPRYEVRKTYEIATRSKLTGAAIREMLDGVWDEGELLRAIDVKEIGELRYQLVLSEGKKREVRRLTRAVGSATVTLKRIQIGRLELGGLGSGKFRLLRKEEVAKLLERG